MSNFDNLPSLPSTASEKATDNINDLSVESELQDLTVERKVNFEEEAKESAQLTPTEQMDPNNVTFLQYLLM